LPSPRAKSKEWTPARKKAFIVSILRGGSRRYPPKYETLNEAKTEKKINKASGRLAQHFLCAECSKEFPAKLIQVDHIEPVVDPAIGFQDWNSFIERLFCDKGNLQTLCKACHAVKTAQEKQNIKKEKQKL
jgi:5-methylcytosine-specific restriction endonuclease McrA